MTKQEASIYNKKRYQAKKEQIKAQVRAYKKANPDKVRKWNKEHDKRRPDLVKARYQRNHKRHYHERKDKIRNRALQYLYGLTLTEFNQRASDQQGLCAICKRVPKKRKVRSGGTATRLCVDHDHTTGKVRSLLCPDCNMALGHIEKSIEYIPAMLQYIENYK